MIANHQPPATALGFRGLRKVYPDGTVALEHFDLDVPHGQFCVILGPSGSGKSTMLRAVNGLIEPTAGTITLHNEQVSKRNLRKVRCQVGTIHQSFNLSGRLKVLYNVCGGASGTLPAWRNVGAIFPKPLERKACKLLQRVGLDEKHLYRRAQELSGGQQQRVGIARAFILDPPVILADEPVASLDPETSREILTLLRDASRERDATVLCSLHQIDLAREFADRIVGISAGSVVFDGTPDQLNERALRAIYRAPELAAEDEAAAAAAARTAQPTAVAAEVCHA